MSFQAWVILILAFLAVGAILTAIIFRLKLKNKKAELTEEETAHEETARAYRLSVADNEGLLKYMADHEKMEEIQEDDYAEFKVAEDKHAVISSIFDRIYGLPND